MPNTLSQDLEKAHEVDQSKELFKEQDLQEFNKLIATKEDFDEMIKGFEDEKTIMEIKKIKGLKETIDTYLKTKTGLNDILTKDYDALAKDADLYEVAVLGAILSQEKKIDTPDYKALAKAYVETLQPTEKKVEVLTENDFGTKYETAKAETNAKDILNNKTVSVEKITEISDQQKITEAEVSVSAGADTRLMDIEKGKEIYTTKKDKLKSITENFTGDNKKQINDIFFELYGENIADEKSMNAYELKKKIDADKTQEGNYYLIGARVAEGFIDVLKRLSLDPEPKLTLDIDRTKCSIGMSGKKGNIEDDRYLKLTLEIKKEEVKIGEKNQSRKEVIEEDKETGASKVVVYHPEEEHEEGKEEVIGGDQSKKGGPHHEEIIRVNKENAPTRVPEKIETKEAPGENPDTMIAERIRIALKEYKMNNTGIDKDKNIQSIKKTANPDQFIVTIKDKDLLFTCKKIDKDRNFDKDEKGNPKVKEAEKKYYEMKLLTTEAKDKFKVYDVSEKDKNITTALNETKTVEAFKAYYAIDKGYGFDPATIKITKDTTGDLQTVTTDVKFTLPKTILDNQNKDSIIKEDIIENVVFDKNGEINAGSGSVYKEMTGKNDLIVLTKNKDANDNYTKEKKKLTYYLKSSDKNITIINDELTIDPTTKLADRNDKRKATQVENADNTKKKFEKYTTDLEINFKKRQINSLEGNKYELMVIPNIKGIDESEYIKIPFDYTFDTQKQTSNFLFDKAKMLVPQKYADTKNPGYFVTENLYYKIEIPTGQQPSINPRIVLDHEETKTETLNKTNKTGKNAINENPNEKADNSTGGRQNRSIALVNGIRYNNDRYQDFSIDENTKSITYTREISLNEPLGFDKKNPINTLILGTIKFDGKGEIIETEDRLLKVNKANQTLEVKDLFGWNKTLAIPFEIKEGVFTIGKNSNPKADYIVQEFNKQKEYLKNRIYSEKSTITNKLNEQIQKIGTQQASEYPGLMLSVPKEGLWKDANKNTVDALQYLKGPTSKGLYYLEINNAYKEGNHTRDAEFLYFKVSGDAVQLTDMNDNEVDLTYLQSNKQYKPGKGLLEIKKDLTMRTIKDIEEQEQGYPELIDAPETMKRYLTKTVDDAKPANYERETSGKYLRTFGNSNIGYIASLPIKAEEKNKNEYLYNKEGLKQTTKEDMAKDLRDYDVFKNLPNAAGLKESELKDIFMDKFKNHKDIDEATEGDNIRIKNGYGKYEYRKISGSKDGRNVYFKDNETSKEIKEKVEDNIKKDLAILASIENIRFKYSRSDEKKDINDWHKAGNRTIKDLKKTDVTDFIKKENSSEKKLSLQLLGPAETTITLDINDGIYEKIDAEDLAKGYYKNLFEEKLGDGADKEATVQEEKYKVYLKSDDEKKENRIIFESQVETAKQ